VVVVFDSDESDGVFQNFSKQSIKLNQKGLLRNRHFRHQHDHG